MVNGNFHSTNVSARLLQRFKTTFAVFNQFQKWCFSKRYLFRLLRDHMILWKCPFYRYSNVIFICFILWVKVYSSNWKGTAQPEDRGHEAFCIFRYHQEQMKSAIFKCFDAALKGSLSGFFSDQTDLVVYWAAIVSLPDHRLYRYIIDVQFKLFLWKQSIARQGSWRC